MLGQTTTPGPPGNVPDPTTLDGLFAVGARIAGLAFLAGVAAMVVSFVYRWYVRESIPDGIAVLVGTAVVAVWLNTLSALQATIQGDATLLDPRTAGYTIAAIVAGAVVADVGRRIGDAAGQRTTRVASLGDLGEAGRIVRARGRSLVVELPDDPGDLENLDGYDPVPDEVKESLAGSSFAFPRGLTVAELHDRLVRRLEEDHGVGHVDLGLDADGTVTYLAIGSRAAGIGNSLVPGTAGVAIRGDPPFGASPGDTVQVWRGGEDPKRVAVGEYRGSAGDVVTLALDERDAREIDPEVRYRVVTMPGRPTAEREFADLLRTADETMGAVTVDAGSPLVGVPVGALFVTVIAVGSPDGVEAIPSRSRQIAAGETVYVVARPEDLRRFEAAANPTEREPSTPGGDGSAVAGDGSGFQ